LRKAALTHIGTKSLSEARRKTDGGFAFEASARFLQRHGRAESDIRLTGNRAGNTEESRMSDALNPPSAEHLAALRAFAAKVGKNWKAALLLAWETGTDTAEEGGAYLRQLRNQQGPEWLAKVRLSKRPAWRADLPWIAYTVCSADQCTRTDIYQEHGGEMQCYEGTWEPHEPYAQTDFVSVEAHRADGAITIGDLDGDEHRDLEDRGQLDAFMVAVLGGQPVADAAAALIGAAAEQVS